MAKTYCDECLFLQNREIKVKGKVTGTRYYCPVINKWYGIGTTEKEIGFMYCDCGKRKEEQDAAEKHSI